MTLRTALIVDGDSEAGQRALAELDQSIERVERDTRDLASTTRAAGASASQMARDAQLAAGRTATLGNNQRLASHHASNLAFQLQDVVVALQMGQSPMQVALQQGGQIGQIMAQAGIGVGGLAREVGAIAVRFAPFAIAIGAGAGAVALLRNEVSKGIDTEAIIDGMNLTEKQLARLEDRGITFGDVMGGVWDAIVAKIEGEVTAALEDMGLSADEVFGFMLSAAKTTFNAIIGFATLVPRILLATWRIIPAGVGDLFVTAANAAIGAIEGLLKGAVLRANAFIAAVNAISPIDIGFLGLPNFGRLENQWTGAGARLGGALVGAVTDTVNRDFLGEAADGIRPYVEQRFRDRIRSEAGKGDKDKDRQERARRERAKGLSEEEKAYREAMAAATRYNQQLVDETANIGLNAVQQKEREATLAATAAAEAALKAPTEAQRQALLDQSKAITDNLAKWKERTVAQEAIDYETNVIEPIRREAQVIDLVGWARGRALLQLEREAELRPLLARLLDAEAKGENAVADALRRQIALINEKYGLQIQMGDRTEQLERERKAAEEVARGYDELKRMGVGALSAMAFHGEDAIDVLKRLALSLADAALEAALLGTGPLAAIFGGGGGSSGSSSGGGLIGAIIGAFGGGKAEGGSVSPGKFYAVNERSTAPGLFFPIGPGVIQPPGRGTSANDNGPMRVSLSIANDFRGAAPEAVGEINSRLDRMQRELPDTILRTMSDARARFIWR